MMIIIMKIIMKILLIIMKNEYNENDNSKWW